MKMLTTTHRKVVGRRLGFTLLEMVMVMFVLTLLLGAIFAIVRGTVQLTDELAIAQSKEARLNGFYRLCERMFRHLPAEAMVRLRNKQAGNRYLYQLTLVNAPSPLGTGGGVVTVLETEETPDGYLRLSLRSMNAEQAVAWERGGTAEGIRLLLFDQIANLEWRFFNPLSGEWEPLWNEGLSLPSGAMGANSLVLREGSEVQDGSLSLGTGFTVQLTAPNVTLGGMRGQRPHLIELRFSLGADAPVRWLFWTPPLYNSEP